MKRVGYYLYKKNYIKANEIDVIRYALEMIISEYLVTLCIYLLLAIVGYAMKATVHIILFTLLRRLLKGYHMQSILGCSILSSILFIVGTTINFQTFRYEIMTLVLLLLLLVYIQQKVNLKAIITSLMLICIVASNVDFINVISITCFEVIILAKIQRKEEDHHEQLTEDNMLSSD